MMAAPVYISNGGDALGPYEISQLRAMWGTGQITADTLYWNQEGNEWRSIVELKVGGTEPAKASASMTDAAKPETTRISFEEKNPIGYYVSLIGGIGFAIGFLNGLSQSIGSIGLVGSVAFSVGHGIPMFLLFAAVGGIIGLLKKRRRKSK